MIEEEIIGYKWNNFQAASNAMNAARTHFGVPVENGRTLEGISVWESYTESGDIDFYFTFGDLSPLFGSPKSIMIRTK